jgi:hypothetical protein
MEDKDKLIRQIYYNAFGFGSIAER